MAYFSDAYAITMQIEGGYSNNPDDPGGETYMGIARNYNSYWPGWLTIDAIKKLSPHNLNEALHADEVLSGQIMAFYKHNYWDVNKTALINDQQLANQVFDTAVNCGTGTAAKFLQEAAGVLADKEIGIQTIAAVNSANTEDVYNKFINLRRQYYVSLIAKKPRLGQFKASWFSRLKNYQKV